MGFGRWVPVQERSRSLALVYSGMYTGSILGLALSPHLIEVRPIPLSRPRRALLLNRRTAWLAGSGMPSAECSQEGLVEAQRDWASHRLICLTLQWLHWPSVFYIFGSLGVLWYFVWEWRSASAPDEDDRCSQAEKDLLAKNTVERVGPMHSCVFRIPVQASDGV